MADFTKFADRNKNYTAKELDKVKLLDDNLIFKEVPVNSGIYKMVGTVGEFITRQLPSQNLMVTGVEPGHYAHSVFGYIHNAPNGEWSTIGEVSRTNIMNFDESNVSDMVISSDSEEDVGKEVTIYGLQYNDGDWNFRKVAKTLNGTTDVSLANEFMTVLCVRNTGNEELDGTVTVENPNRVYGSIVDGDNNFQRSLMAYFVVPAGYVGIVTHISAAIGEGKEAKIAYKQKRYGEVSTSELVLEVFQFAYEKDVHYAFDEKTVLTVEIRPSGQRMDASACFDIILIEKPIFESLYGGFNIFCGLFA